jgi:hypothetical protein
MPGQTRTSYCEGVLSGPRLRQVALVARDCGQVAGELSRAFGWPPPYHDPGVGRFGLTNAVFAAGDTFVEVVAPARFVPARGGHGEGITEVTIAGLPGAGPWMIGGVRFAGEEG